MARPWFGRFLAIVAPVGMAVAADGECAPPRDRLSPFGGPGAENHTMEYRPLGRSGLRVSAISYGAWLTVSESGMVPVDRAVAIFREAVRHGVNFIDNAEAYGAFPGESEFVVGQALERLFAEGEVQRSDLVISTKLWNGGWGVNDKGLSRKHIVEGLQSSLRRLRLEYVDVVFCHRPDPTTPLEETVRAMNHLLDRGWAFYWGTSEWTAAEIARAEGIAQRLGLVGPIVEQPLYNLFNRRRVEQEYLPLYDQPGLGLTVYSPLAEGILAGRYSSGAAPAGSRAATVDRKKGLTEQANQIAAAKALEPLAAEVGCTLPQLVLAWTVRHPRVSTAIVGASSPKQLAETAGGAMSCLRKLTPEYLERVEAVAAVELEPDAVAGQIGRALKERGPHA